MIFPISMRQLIVVFVLGAGALYSQTLTINNADRPSLTPNFYIGDHYRYEITNGPPNQPVSDYVCRLGVFCTWQDFGIRMQTDTPSSRAMMSHRTKETTSRLGTWEDCRSGQRSISGFDRSPLAELPSW